MRDTARAATIAEIDAAIERKSHILRAPLHPNCYLAPSARDPEAAEKLRQEKIAEHLAKRGSEAEAAKKDATVAVEPEKRDEAGRAEGGARSRALALAIGAAVLAVLTTLVLIG